MFGRFRMETLVTVIVFKIQLAEPYCPLALQFWTINTFSYVTLYLGPSSQIQF